MYIVIAIKKIEKNMILIYYLENGIWRIKFLYID